MMPTTTTTVQTTLPTRLAEQMDALTREGWFPNADVRLPKPCVASWTHIVPS
jgi:hypothetical protein